jgi:malate dehydrogenase (oxaloacetate-decarboxylating)
MRLVHELQGLMSDDMTVCLDMGSFPLSNPTSHCEAKAKDLIEWTNGKALVATGSPFAPVQYGDKKIAIAQCNNVYIFPAVGLGVVAANASRVTDGMLLAAAHALAENSPALHDPSAQLLPYLTDIRRVAAEVAFAVGLAAQQEGVAPKTTSEELRARIQQSQWAPEYCSIHGSDTGHLEVTR